MEECKEAAKAAKQVKLPSDQQVQAALEELRSAVEVWINGSAEAVYVYDNTWGGLINCGCNYTFVKGEPEDKGSCSNTAPYECPAFESVNVDFGNGWYNDHHYHVSSGSGSRLNGSFSTAHLTHQFCFLRTTINS